MGTHAPPATSTTPPCHPPWAHLPLHAGLPDGPEDAKTGPNMRWEEEFLLLQFQVEGEVGWAELSRTEPSRRFSPGLWYCWVAPPPTTCPLLLPTSTAGHSAWGHINKDPFSKLRAPGHSHILLGSQSHLVPGQRKAMGWVMWLTQHRGPIATRGSRVGRDRAQDSGQGTQDLLSDKL